MKYTCLPVSTLCCVIFSTTTHTADTTQHYGASLYDHARDYKGTLALATKVKLRHVNNPEVLQNNKSVGDFIAVANSFHRFVLRDNNEVIGLSECLVNDENLNELQKNDGIIETMAFADGVDNKHQKLLTSKIVETLKKLGVSRAWLVTQKLNLMGWPDVKFEIRVFDDGTALTKIAL
jgi:hypothetical protein